MEPDADVHFFEGVEKLLEVWFDRDAGNGQSLRSIPRWQLEKLLTFAHCQICSVVNTDCMDAYVLSESSMFISDERFILKTCGSTTLLHTVKPLLALAKKYCGYDKVQNVFYSRKNFLRPELQPEPHTSFEDEVARLDEIFGGDGVGAGYCLGRVNQNRWYLYTLNPAIDCSIEYPDQTLEILMTDLDPEVMSVFTTLTCSNGREATKLSGIDKLLPRTAIIDDKLFEPHGYSMNAVMPDSDRYVTMHITPEPEFSYVSFETNFDQGCYFDLINRVLFCFRPGKFLLTVFADQASTLGQEGQKDVWKKEIPGYRRTDAQFLKLTDGGVAYANYVCVPPAP